MNKSFTQVVWKTVGESMWETCGKVSTIFDVFVELLYSIRKFVRFSIDCGKVLRVISTENLFGFSLLWVRFYTFST